MLLNYPVMDDNVDSSRMDDVDLLELNPEEIKCCHIDMRWNEITLKNDWSSLDFRLASTWIWEDTCFLVRDLPVRILI